MGKTQRRITFYITEEEREAALKLAKQHQVDIGQLARALLLKVLIQQERSNEKIIQDGE